jgi:uncharacterized membrane protein YvbJ
MAVTVKMKKLLQKVKDNLILQHDGDDTLLLGYIAAAVSYAETYQHKPENFYAKRGNNMSAATEQAVIMMSSHFYESRDGGTGGFFSDYIGSVANVWQTVHRLLAMDKRWDV